VTSMLYNPESRIEVVTSLSRRHSFPLSQFVGGAVLASIVSRAKKTALKRYLDDPGDPGISTRDLESALRAEFVASAEQLAHARLEAEFAMRSHGQPLEAVKTAEVVLGDQDLDPWSMEKVRLFPELAPEEAA